MSNSKMLAFLRMLKSYPERLANKISFSSIVIDSHVDKTAALDSFVRFYRSSLGRYSYIGRDSFVEHADIGSFTSIGGSVVIGGGSHPLDWVSTSPVFHAGKNILNRNFASFNYDPFATTIIGNDVWIGYGAIIMAGLSIGDGAVIGAGSVLTKNVGPYEIWAGNPARMIRKRHSESVCKSLQDSQWWNWDDNRLESGAHLICSPSEFLSWLAEDELSNE